MSEKKLNVTSVIPVKTAAIKRPAPAITGFFLPKRPQTKPINAATKPIPKNVLPASVDDEEPLERPAAHAPAHNAPGNCRTAPIIHP